MFFRLRSLPLHLSSESFLFVPFPRRYYMLRCISSTPTQRECINDTRKLRLLATLRTRARWGRGARQSKNIIHRGVEKAGGFVASRHSCYVSLKETSRG